MRAPEQLNALRAFEASARHESFSAAASELHVTPAAVGQLVRSLEDGLGTPLFHRGTSGRTRLVLTDAARRALPEIRAGFESLSLGVARLKEGSASGVLTVTVSPAFAAKWLVPRLDRFQAAWPEMDVRLDVATQLLDFGARGIDVGVRYGAGRWPGLTAEKLMDEEVYPVCSPVLQQRSRLRRPADLAGFKLDPRRLDRSAGRFRDVEHLAPPGRRKARHETGAPDQQLGGRAPGRDRRSGCGAGSQHHGARRPRRGPARAPVPGDRAPVGARVLRRVST